MNFMMMTMTKMTKMTKMMTMMMRGVRWGSHMHRNRFPDQYADLDLDD